MPGVPHQRTGCVQAITWEDVVLPAGHRQDSVSCCCTVDVVELPAHRQAHMVHTSHDTVQTLTTPVAESCMQ